MEAAQKKAQQLIDDNAVSKWLLRSLQPRTPSMALTLPSFSGLQQVVLPLL
jgi:hypothetical protein